MNSEISTSETPSEIRANEEEKKKEEGLAAAQNQSSNRTTRPSIAGTRFRLFGRKVGKGAVQKKKDEEKEKKLEKSNNKKARVTLLASEQKQPTPDDINKETEKIIQKANEEKRRRERDQPEYTKFPCCFYIPLDIVMIFFGIFDLIFFTLFSVCWITLVTLEPFKGRQGSVKRNRTLTTDHLRALVELLGKNQKPEKTDEEYYYDTDFAESTTTLGPPVEQDEEIDPDKTAEIFSRVGNFFHANKQSVYDNCGENYYKDFLYLNELEITRDVFEDLARHVIFGSLLYAISAGMLLTCVCCFRGHKVSKILIIMLWYSQIMPAYFLIEAAVQSQSQTLCILGYGLSAFNGQQFIFYSVLIPLAVYKPYEIFIWSYYIRSFFQNHNGDLMDESYFTSIKVEQRLKRRLDKAAGGALETAYDYKHRYKQHERIELFRKLEKRHHHITTSQRLAVMKVLPWWNPKAVPTDPKKMTYLSSSSSD